MASRGALARGAAAGAIGTAVMSAAQRLATKPRRSGGDEDAGAPIGPRAEQQDPWEHAPAPAKAARQILEGAFDREVPPRKIGLLTNATHWATGRAGVCSTACFRAQPGSRRAMRADVRYRRVGDLVPDPRSDGDLPSAVEIPTASWRSISYHLAYGAGVGGGFALIDC